MTTPERLGREGLRQKEKLETRQFVIPIEEYQGRSERLQGMRELLTVSATIPSPFFVARHEAFEEYKAQGMTEDLKGKLLWAFHEIRKRNPERGAFVGWRTITQEKKVPPGPRTAAIFEKNEFVAYTKKAWQFAIDNGYDQEGDEVVLAFHPFIHAGQKPIPEDYFLWPGGDAAPLADGRIKLRTSYGPDEITQSCPCDIYLVNKGRYGTEIRKTIAKKTDTLLPEEGYPPSKIPPDYQNRQVLKDSQIVEIAEVVENLYYQYGFRRVEFMLQQEGMIFRESTPYDPEPANFFFLEKPIQEPIVVINSKEDIERLNPPKAIVFLPQHLFLAREVPDISLFLVNRAQQENIELAVLSWGEIETQHMAKNFQAAEISVIFIGDEVLMDGQKVRVWGKEGGIGGWEIIGEKKSQIIDLQNPRSKKRDWVGEKAANLAILAEHDIPVVPGFSLSTTILEEYLQSLGLDGTIKALDKLEGKALVEQITVIRNRIFEGTLPRSLVKAVKERLNQFPGREFSVRSSSSHEDLAAGQFRSSLNVPLEEVPAKAKECFASLFSLAAIQNAKRSEIQPSTMKMAVLIHPMLEGRGGVIHVRPSETVISAQESAEVITAGTKASYHKITFKRNKEKPTEEIPLEGRIITLEEAKDLASLSYRIYTIFEVSQDIEWIITPQGEIYILQARPA